MKLILAIGLQFIVLNSISETNKILQLNELANCFSQLLTIQANNEITCPDQLSIYLEKTNVVSVYKSKFNLDVVPSTQIQTNTGEVSFLTMSELFSNGISCFYLLLDISFHRNNELVITAFKQTSNKALKFSLRYQIQAQKWKYIDYLILE